MEKCGGTPGLSREGVSRATDDTNGESNGQPENQLEAQSTRYEVGPGFEIAIRAALNKPLEVHLKADDKGPQRQAPSADHEHRHDVLEQRLDAVERALFIIVDQLKSIDKHIGELNRRLPPP
jgi:hypothetical protein